ncbi:prepilin-type N-terminal cleavage/methylation domain-containing protein [Patescibacteria group bacterium]
MKNNSINKRDKKGFTLIEILVGIAIIGILAAIGIVAFNGARAKARIADAQADIRSIVNAIKVLEFDTSEWPNHQPANIVCTNLPNPPGCPADNEVEDLNTDAAGIMQTDGTYLNWNGPYLTDMPVDPWGTNYFIDTDYDVNGTDYAVVGSYGPNTVGKNIYDDDDIIISLLEDL